jgi:intracellular sulfur oxidation DsrE/DsrF family protein
VAARVAIFLTHADAGALRLAGSCALAAVAMESRVDVFVFGEAVAALLAAEGDADHPGARLLTARAAGCRLLACSASVVEEKVDLTEATAGYDAVVGWPTVLEWSREVVDRFFF